MRLLSCLAVAAICVEVAAAASSMPPMATLTAGKTEVVLGERPTRVAQFAAEEMTNFLSRVFGAPVPVVAKPTPGMTGIWLGTGVDVSNFARDEFIIKAEPERVIIAGRDSVRDDPKKCVAMGWTSQFYERATLFGVYEFLERFARCRFYFPGELGEIVPRSKSISVSSDEIRIKPDMMARRVYSGYGSSPKACDGVWFEERPKESDGKSLNWLRLRFETENHPCCHGLIKFNYIERFGKTKPEYFALLSNGTRSNNPKVQHPGQLCLTSGIYEEIYQDVRAYLKGENAATRGLTRWGNNCVDGRYVDVMGQDGMVACQCPNCQAEYARCKEIYGKDHDYANNWATELVWSNTCQIARRLTEEGIKGTVTQMAYYPYRHVPRMEIPVNVDVMVAEHGPWSVLYPEKMKAQIDEIRSWAEKLGRPVWIWTYPGKYRAQAYPGIPHMTPKCIGVFYKEAAPYIFGSFMESESDRFLYGYLNYYVVSRIFWDRNADVDAILKEHYDLMFGPAASEMQTFFEKLEHKWTHEVVGKTMETALGPQVIRATDTMLWGEIYSPQVMAEYDGLLKKAASKVAPGSIEARRIALFRREFYDNMNEPMKAFQEKQAKVKALVWKASSDPSGALEISHFHGGVKPSQPVSTRVTAEKTAMELVVVVDCAEPRMEDVVAVDRAKDDVDIWKDNDVELFLNVSGDRVNYYKFMLNSKGSFTDMKCVKGGAGPSLKDVKWDSGATAVAEMRPGGWRAVFKIPLKAFPECRNSFPADILRGRALVGGAEYYNWSPYTKVIDQLENFGTFDFGGAVCPHAAVTLTAGKTEVVLGEKPTRVAQFAAEEMTNFLSRVFGAPVPVVAKPTSGMTGIWLGTGVDVSNFARDEFLIKAESGRVIIAGRDSVRNDPKRCVAIGSTSQWYERATLFGVYEFLERFAGCRFYFPGELGEIVPRSKSISVPGGEIRVKPDMMVRRVYSGGGSSPKAYDGVWFEERPKESDGKALNWLRLRFETENHPCCHGLNKFNYIERFGKTKPEYFALLSDGTRSNNPNKPHPGQLCLTSGIYEEIYQDVRAYLKGENAAVRGLTHWGQNCVDGRYVDIMCQDGMAACQCPNCKAEYVRCKEIYGKDHDYADNWATELVWSNTCQIARRLTEEGIKGTVTQMAYYPYRHVPRVEIPANVDVMVAERGPWSVPRPEKMKAEIDEIRSWAQKLGRPVWIWTYPGKYGQQAYPGIPHMTPKCVGTFYKAAAPYIFGSFMESESDRFLYGYLNYYVVSRIFWDRNADVDAILNEHYDLMFGPAASEMKEFCNLLERKWVMEIAGNVKDTPIGPVGVLPSAYEVWTKVYSCDVLNELRGLLTAAAAKVSPGSLEARRIDLMCNHLLGGLEEAFRKYMDRIDPKVEEAWRAAHPGQRSIVANGDFSVGRIGASHAFGKMVGQEMVGWYGSRNSMETDLDANVFRSAPASMRIAQSKTDLSQKTRSSIRQYVADGERRLKPNTRYRLSFFVKLDNVSPLKRGGGVVARVWDDDRGIGFPSPADGGPLTGTTDWIAQSYEFTSGPNTNGSRKSYVDVDVLWATGTIWVDDVRLEVVADAGVVER